MKVLWVVNILIPEAAECFQERVSNFSGGWLTGGYNALKQLTDTEIVIAFPYKCEKSSSSASGTEFYSFIEPRRISDKNIKKLIRRAKQIISSVKPDVIHIYGTEFMHSYAFQKAAIDCVIPTVISIQGLVSEYATHFYSDLPLKVIYGMSLRNILLGDSVCGIKQQLKKKGKIEIRAIQDASYIIGRTDWDMGCVKKINNKIKYYHNDETLRDSFYGVRWERDKCTRNTIMVSQCSSPVKGFHYLIDALTIVKKQIPDIKVIVAGKDITGTKSFMERINKTYYMKYCHKKINKKQLDDNFVFLDRLSEKKMCESFLNTNLFVLPSSIENSPNALCEAMLLGVPCIASFVGGVPSIVEHNKTGMLYPHNSISVLAKYIFDILSDTKLQDSLSVREIQVAEIRHDRRNNAHTLRKIYDQILIDYSESRTE